MAQSIFLYKNLQEISALTFHEVKFTGRIVLLDKNFKEGRHYEVSELVLLDEKWSKLYDEYFEKSLNPRYKKNLKTNDKSLKLLIQITVVDKIVGLLRFLNSQKEYVPGETFLQTVSHFGNELKRINKRFKFDTTKPIEDQLKPIETYVGGLKSRYEILFKKELNVEETDIITYYEIKADMAQVLQMDDIPDYINMLQWIVYENKVLKSAKYGEQHSRRRRSKRNNQSLGRS